MGLGKFVNGRHQPITKYEGSWAHVMQQIREGKRKAFIPDTKLPIERWVTLKVKP